MRPTRDPPYGYDEKIAVTLIILWFSSSSDRPQGIMLLAHYIGISLPSNSLIPPRKGLSTFSKLLVTYFYYY